MEKLINQIPSSKQYGTDKNGEKILRGICLRYSVNRKKWVCGYGAKLHGDSERIEADDPVEALAFFVELLNKK